MSFPTILMIVHHTSMIVHPLLYLDPGSGSMLVQMILAALLGIGVLIRVFWSKITGIFGAKNTPTQPGEDKEDEE